MERHTYETTVGMAIKAMRENLATGISLADLADAVYLSPYHFHRVFHKAVGAPPGQFFTALRLDMAKRLLLTTSESVINICFNVGYASPNTFSSTFTKLVGIPPRNFRNLPHIVSDSGVWQMLFDSSAEKNIYTTMGKVTGPADFQGRIFVGAFPKRIPQATPQAGTVLDKPGGYSFPLIHDGSYYIMVAAIPTAEPNSLFIPGQNMLVGIGDVKLNIIGGKAQNCVNIDLRKPTDTDPPVVVALSQLLLNQNAAQFHART